MTTTAVGTLMDSLTVFPTCNVNVNIGIAFIQRWRARQLVESWHLYRAVPGASSRHTANRLERRLDWLSAVLKEDRPSLTLSVLGEHATGDANPRRNTNGWSVQRPAFQTPLMGHSVTPN